MPRTPPLENLKTLMSLESHTPPPSKKKIWIRALVYSQYKLFSFGFS